MMTRAARHRSRPVMNSLVGRPRRTVAAAACATILLTGTAAMPAARGDFIVISTPTSASTGATTLIPLPAQTTTPYSAVGDAVQTISFANAVTTNAGAGTSFGWGTPPTVESSSPLTFFTNQNTETLNLSAPATTFGLELMGNSPTLSPFLEDQVTATFFSGTKTVGTITKQLDAPGGARLFAASTTTDPFTRVTLSIVPAFSSSPGLLGAQLRYTVAAVPEPPVTALVAACLAVIGVFHARRRRGPVAA